MPDKFNELFTSSSFYLATFAGCGGCILRYLEEYRHTKEINLKYLIADLASSAFLGYLAFWFCVENTSFTLSQCAIATCLVGNFGSRIFDILYFIVFRKLGIPRELQINLNLEENSNDSKRDKK